MESFFPKIRPSVCLILLVAGLGIASCSFYKNSYVIDQAIGMQGVQRYWPYPIVKIDGRAVVREIINPLSDAFPRVVVTPGSHEFTVETSLATSGSDHVPKTEIFVFEVGLRKNYILIDKDGFGHPTLVEVIRK